MDKTFSHMPQGFLHSTITGVLTSGSDDFERDFMEEMPQVSLDPITNNDSEEKVKEVMFK